MARIVGKRSSDWLAWLMFVVLLLVVAAIVLWAIYPDWVANLFNR